MNKITVTFEIPAKITVDVWPGDVGEDGAERPAGRSANIDIVAIDGEAPATKTKARLDGDMVVAVSKVAGRGGRVTVEASKVGETTWVRGQVSGVSLKLSSVNWTTATITKVLFAVGEPTVEEVVHGGNGTAALATATATEAAETSV